MLNSLGFSISDPAGYYGDSTLFAVKRVQHAKFQLNADGIVDQKLLENIEKIYSDWKKKEPENELLLLGRIVRSNSKIGIADLTVKVFDSDRYTDDDFLGEGRRYDDADRASSHPRHPRRHAHSRGRRDLHHPGQRDHRVAAAS